MKASLTITRGVLYLAQLRLDANRTQWHSQSRLADFHATQILMIPPPSYIIIEVTLSTECRVQQV